MHKVVAVICVMTSPLFLRAGEDDVQSELRNLQGRWKVVALEAGGMPLPDESVPNFVFIVEADGKATGRMGKSEYQAKITVDPKKSPKTIVNAHETGQHKGKKQYGVYKVEGGKWIVCMTAPGAAESDRPKSFDTKSARNVVFTFERIKVAGKGDSPRPTPPTSDPPKSKGGN